MGFLAWPMTEALLKILLTIKKKNTSQLSNKCNFDSLKWNVNPNDNDNEVNL